MGAEGQDATSSGGTRIVSDELAVTTRLEVGAASARASANESSPEREGDQGRQGERADQAQQGAGSHQA